MTIPSTPLLAHSTHVGILYGEVPDACVYDEHMLKRPNEASVWKLLKSSGSNEYISYAEANPQPKLGA